MFRNRKGGNQGSDSGEHPINNLRRIIEKEEWDIGTLKQSHVTIHVDTFVKTFMSTFLRITSHPVICLPVTRLDFPLFFYTCLVQNKRGDDH